MLTVSPMIPIIGYTPLHRAAEKGYLSTVKLLVSYNKNNNIDSSSVDSTNSILYSVAKDGYTTAYDAARRYPLVCEYLRELMEKQ